MNDPVAAYFGAERAEALVFIGVALVAIEIAVLCWRRSGTPQAKGAAVSLVLVAAIQLAVGTTIFVRSPDDRARVAQAVTVDLAHVRTHERSRMKQVMRKFVVYGWIELGLLVAAIGLAWAARPGFWRGVGLGLAPQAALMLLLDHVAERRGEVYLAWLDGL
jgi:hypothetical protein